MKKLVAVMLLGIALLGTTSAQNLKSMGLQGKVHTLEEETWGLTLKFGEYVKNNLINKETSTYDDKGKIMKKTVHAAYIAGILVDFKLIYIYDDKGNNTEIASYNADGSLSKKSIYTYDDKGNNTEIASYNADGSLFMKVINTYDDKGNKTEAASYNAGGSLFMKVINTYDDKGNNTEMASYNADGSLAWEYIYTYDDKGNNTEMASYNADGSLSRKEIYTYEYDKFGNWTKKITSAEVSKFGKVYLEPQEVTIRTITYYP